MGEKVGLERIRRLVISRRVARRIVRRLRGLAREAREGRELPVLVFDEPSRLEARRLAGELDEQEALRLWRERLIWAPLLFGLLGALVVGGKVLAPTRLALFEALLIVSVEVVGGFAFYGILYWVEGRRFRRMGAWIRNLDA